MVAFVVRWVLLAVAVVLAAWVTPDADFRGGPFSALVVAALIAAANIVAQLALRWIPRSDNVVLLAALTLLVNACAVWVASALTTRLHISGLVAAVTFTLLVTVLSVVLAWLVDRLLARRAGSVAAQSSGS